MNFLMKDLNLAPFKGNNPLLNDMLVILINTGLNELIHVVSCQIRAIL